MQKDLLLTVVTAFIGVAVAYAIFSGILGEPKPYTIKTVDSVVNTSVSDPDPEVFNYRALNPTVEVFIDCASYDADGSCLEGTGN